MTRTHYAFVSIALALTLPMLAHGEIRSRVEAVSNTGGNSVGPGGRVITGDASASVQVTTRGSHGSSTSTFEIRTESNGQVHEEVVTTQKPARVWVQATPQETVVQVIKDDPPQTSKLGERIAELVRNFLASLF